MSDLEAVQKEMDQMKDSEFIQFNLDNMNEQFKAQGPEVVEEMGPFIRRFEQIRDRFKQEGR